MFRDKTNSLTGHDASPNEYARNKFHLHNYFVKTNSLMLQTQLNALLCLNGDES
jgi:hypothetical protein